MLNVDKIKTTVICHFYNEEWLLPHWLSHHINIFDSGIMINYRSTDKSTEIIKKIAPNWKIVDTKNQWFDAELCDTEVMKIEEEIQGWKIVLNTTEFLILSNLKEKIRKIQQSKLDMVRFKGYQINDTKEQFKKGFDNSKLIIKQRYHGFEDPWRDRILHKQKNGSYYIGRHYLTPGLKTNSYSKINHKNIPVFDGLYLFWYRFSPLKEQISRKIQISTKIPKSDIEKGLGWNHWNLNEYKIKERWEKEEPKGKNILENLEIKKEYENLRDTLVWQ